MMVYCDSGRFLLLAGLYKFLIPAVGLIKNGRFNLPLNLAISDQVVVDSIIRQRSFIVEIPLITAHTNNPSSKFVWELYKQL